MKALNDDELAKVIGGTNANVGMCGNQYFEQDCPYFNESNEICINCPGKPLCNMRTKGFEINKGDNTTTANFGLIEKDNTNVDDWNIVNNK